VRDTARSRRAVQSLRPAGAWHGTVRQWSRHGIVFAVAHAQLLGLFDQLAQRLITGTLEFEFEGQHILEPDVTVRADHREWNLAILEPFDQVRSGDTDQVGGLLRGQLRLERCDSDGVTLGEFGEGALQDLYGARGQGDGFASDLEAEFCRGESGKLGARGSGKLGVVRGWGVMVREVMASG
jgi:hypothetical protein